MLLFMYGGKINHIYLSIYLSISLYIYLLQQVITSAKCVSTMFHAILYQWQVIYVSTMLHGITYLQQVTNVYKMFHAITYQ